MVDGREIVDESQKKAKRRKTKRLKTVQTLNDRQIVVKKRKGELEPKTKFESPLLDLYLAVLPNEAKPSDSPISHQKAIAPIALRAPRK